MLPPDFDLSRFQFWNQKGEAERAQLLELLQPATENDPLGELKEDIVKFIQHMTTDPANPDNCRRYRNFQTVMQIGRMMRYTGVADLTGFSLEVATELHKSQPLVHDGWCEFHSTRAISRKPRRSSVKLLK